MLQCRHAPPPLKIVRYMYVRAHFVQTYYKMEIIVRHSDKYNQHGASACRVLKSQKF